MYLLKKEVLGWSCKPKYEKQNQSQNSRGLQNLYLSKILKFLKFYSRDCRKREEYIETCWFNSLSSVTILCAMWILNKFLHCFVVSISNWSNIGILLILQHRLASFSQQQTLQDLEIILNDCTQWIMFWTPCMHWTLNRSWGMVAMIIFRWLIMSGSHFLPFMMKANGEHENNSETSLGLVSSRLVLNVESKYITPCIGK